LEDGNEEGAQEADLPKDAFLYVAKNFQRTGFLMVPKLHREAKVDGSVDIESPAGTVGSAGTLERSERDAPDRRRPLAQTRDAAPPASARLIRRRDRSRRALA
jgi:hypothetical protein